VRVLYRVFRSGDHPLAGITDTSKASPIAERDPECSRQGHVFERRIYCEETIPRSWDRIRNEPPFAQKFPQKFPQKSLTIFNDRRFPCRVDLPRKRSRRGSVTAKDRLSGTPCVQGLAVCTGRRRILCVSSSVCSSVIYVRECVGGPRLPTTRPN